MSRILLCIAALAVAGATAGAQVMAREIEPICATEALPTDADDPAIWVHPDDPALSLIIGTNKAASPVGGLGVFGMDGRMRQYVAQIDRPNNVDVEYGLLLGGVAVDIAACTERYQRRLRVFVIDPERRRLVDVSSPHGLAMFAGEEGEAGAPMGISLYRRPGDGTIFAIVSRKIGPEVGYLWQYRLEDDGSGRVCAQKVRVLGHCTPGEEIEAVAVDDEAGIVYYAEEGVGIHAWHADPDHPQADQELALFATEAYEGDREGIAVYADEDGSGFVLSCDQIEDGSLIYVYPRITGADCMMEPLTVVRTEADDTDGIELCVQALGPAFPNGCLVMMNSSQRNFLLYDLQHVLGQ